MHAGDVTVQADGDLLGETVNIAARLEALAEPGGVCLSEDTYRQVRDRLTEPFVDLGEKKLKNIARPIRAYAITAAAATGEPPTAQPPRRSRGRKLPAPISVRAPTLRGKIDTVERAVAFIDKSIPPEIAKLPRWTFARAPMVEALKTGKSRDLNTARVADRSLKRRGQRALSHSDPNIFLNETFGRSRVAQRRTSPSASRCLRPG
jgi:hypothetical protein